MKKSPRVYFFDRPHASPATTGMRYPTREGGGLDHAALTASQRVTLENEMADLRAREQAEREFVEGLGVVWSEWLRLRGAFK